MYASFFKRIIDFTVALFVMILLFPVLAVVFVLLCVANQGKPFFIQVRPGWKGALFKIIKFKTMNDKKDQNGNLLPDAERLTKIGQFVRKTSLDEIPQLINVIKGDMSLVGPRPLLVQYLSLYDAFQRRRHEAKPGITGWAQVNGRNTIGWEKKFEYDVWYVDNVSFSLDFKIALLTVKKVFIREGISSDGEATAKPFTGSGSQ